MKAFNKAVLCLAATAMPLNVMALMPVANLNDKTLNAKPVSQTIRMLQEDPLLVHTLDLSDDEKNELMDEVIRASEIRAEESAPAAPENDGLIHKANFFENLFGGGLQQRPQPQYHGQYAPRPSQQIPQERYGQCLDSKGQPYPVGSTKVPVSPGDPAIIFDHESMKNPEDWKVKSFDVVVVVNKSRTGQNVYVYSKLDSANGLPVLVKGGIKVSTGRETPELSNPDRIAQGKSCSDHAPARSYFSNTPTGYFTPVSFSIDHVSGDWEDAAMDHAVFINAMDKDGKLRGIATHKAPGGTEGALGTRASGACMRLTKKDARDLFWLIRRTGGPVTKGEMSGNRFPDRSSPGPSFAAQLKEEQTKGFNTYEATPEIPDFDRNGNVKNAVDAEGKPVLDNEGKPVMAMRKGLARTLVVIESREIARAPVPKKKKTN